MNNFWMLWLLLGDDVDITFIKSSFNKENDDLVPYEHGEIYYTLRGDDKILKDLYDKDSRYSRFQRRDNSKIYYIRDYNIQYIKDYLNQHNITFTVKN